MDTEVPRARAYIVTIRTPPRYGHPAKFLQPYYSDSKATAGTVQDRSGMVETVFWDSSGSFKDAVVLAIVLIDDPVSCVSDSFHCMQKKAIELLINIYETDKRRTFSVSINSSIPISNDCHRMNK